MAEVIANQTTKVYGEVRVQLQPFLSSALYGVSGKLQAPDTSTPGKEPLLLNSKLSGPQTWCGYFIEKIRTELNMKLMLSS
jgi:hypothetical protein